MRPSAGHYQGRSRDSKGDHHGASGSGGGASYSRPALTPTTDFRYSSSSSAGAPGLIPHQQPVMPPAQPYSSYSSASDRWPQRAPLPPQQPDPYIPSYRPPWPDSDRSHSAEFNGQRASYQRSGPRASYPGPSSLPNRPPSRPDSGGSNSNLPPYDPRMPPQPPPMPTSSSSSMPPAVYPPPSYAYPPSHPPPPPHMRPDSWSSAQQSSSSWNLSMAHPSDQRQPPPPPSHMSANPSRKQSRNSHESSAGSSKRQRLDREAHSRRKPPSDSRHAPPAGKSSYTRSDRGDRDVGRRARSPSVDSVGRVRRRAGSVSDASSDEGDRPRPRRRSRSPAPVKASRDFRQSDNSNRYRRPAAAGGDHPHHHHARSRSPSPARSTSSRADRHYDNYSSSNKNNNNKRKPSGPQDAPRARSQAHYRSDEPSNASYPDEVGMYPRQSHHHPQSRRRPSRSPTPPPSRRYAPKPSATPSPGEVSPSQDDDHSYRGRGSAASGQSDRFAQRSPPAPPPRSRGEPYEPSAAPPPRNHYSMPPGPEHPPPFAQPQTAPAPPSIPNVGWIPQSLPPKPKGLPEPPPAVKMSNFKAAFARAPAQNGGKAQMRKFFPGEEEDDVASQSTEQQQQQQQQQPQQEPTSERHSHSVHHTTSDNPVAPTPVSQPPGGQSPIPGLSVEEPIPPPQPTEPEQSVTEQPAESAAESQQQQQQQQEGEAAEQSKPEELYERLAQVGEGTYGKVYKARNTQSGAMVALKRIRMEAEKDGFPITSVREIKLLQSLRHPNVVALSEMMVAKGGVYMVFEYLEHDLTGVLRCPEVTFSPAHSKSIMKQLLQGLAYIHNRGVLHRDLKGSNILLSELGSVKIADFGLARFYARKGRQHDHTNRVITQWYKPPELLYGATMYGAEVDVWSAGCIFLELFSRRPVFQGQDEIHQLDVIYKLMGTPKTEDWPEVGELPWYDLVKPRDAIAPRLRAHFGNSKWLSTEGGLQLAEALLQLNPAKRPSADEALQMPYFTTEEPLPERPTIQGIGEWHEWEAKLAKAASMRKANADAAH